MTFMNLSYKRNQIRTAVLGLVLSTAILVTTSGCGGNNVSTATKLSEVGRAAIDLTDSSRTEKYGPTAGSKRKLAIFVWYPSSASATDPVGPFLTEGQAELVAPIFSAPKEAVMALPTKSHIEATAKLGSAPYPVVVMSHGNGLPVLNYSSTAEYLAARGYIVVGVNHTSNARITLFADGTSAPLDLAATIDGVQPAVTDTSSFADQKLNIEGSYRLDRELTDDLKFVVDQLSTLNNTGKFKGLMDLNKIGVFGHSFGGSHSFRMLRDDARISAAADIDGTIFHEDFASGVAKPYMVISGKRFDASGDQAFLDNLISIGFSTIEANTVLGWYKSDQISFEKSPKAYYVKLNKALHSNFTDAGIWSELGLPADEISTEAPPALLLKISNEYLTGFFDEKLKGLTSTTLRQSPPADVEFKKKP